MGLWIGFVLGIGEQPEHALMAWLGLGSAAAERWHQSILVGIQLLMDSLLTGINCIRD
jgi:hypothetical protein